MSSITNEILNRIKEETLPYCNFQVILDKLYKDGHLNQILSLLQNIFLSEIEFAHEEILKMKKGKFENVNILLQNNIHIFKENLKLILQTSVDKIFTFLTHNNTLDMIFGNDKKERYCEIINELSEEQFCSLMDIQSAQGSNKLFFRDQSKKPSINIFSNLQSQEENMIKEEDEDNIKQDQQNSKNINIELPRYSSDLSTSRVEIQEDQQINKNQSKKKARKMKTLKPSLNQAKRKKRKTKSILEHTTMNRSLDYQTSTLYRNLNSSKDRFQIPNPQRSNKSNINININISDIKKQNYIQKIFGKDIARNFHKKAKNNQLF